MEYFLLILLIAIGYFALVCVAISRADNKRALPNIALGVLLVYGCVIGILAAVGKNLGEAGLLLYAIAAIYSLFFLAWKIYDFFKARPRIHLSALAILVSYLLAVLYVTTFVRERGSNSQIQMEIMNWLKEDGIESFDHTLLNVAMFVPVGALCPFLAERKHKKIFLSWSFGIMLSTAIETGQLLLRSGTCDIDDILSNSLGALIGAVIVTAAMRLKQKREERERNRQGGK